ncbi:hypothetical protein [Candidatus Magnetominusculus dajiuhuensis]|uniref:hypothetical protein n=1 Tax=Candidatus Magnetominusculus dajiuhuensis TaxID=3137712 RepID=UPI003B432B5B
MMARETGIQRHLAFIGKVISLYTHEQKNHLAIINESAGLLGDMLQFSEEIKELPQARQMLDIIKSIDAQIKRSSEMAKYLNAFGHRMDSPTASFNVNDCVGEVLVLLNRLIAQKRITFKADYSSGLPPITGNPSNLQLLVFMAMQELVTVMRENTYILVKTFSSNNSTIIRITPEGLDAPVDFTEQSDYFKPVRAVTINGSGIDIIIPVNSH